MKKKLLIIIAAILCAGGGAIVGYSIYNDDRLVAPTDLPASTTEFVHKYFPGRRVIGAEVDFLDYKVWLSDNTFIEFEWNRNWDKIEVFGANIPTELVPPSITAYVQQNKPNTPITKISKEDYGYEIGLLGSIYEYRFNKAGVYIGLDD